MARKAMVVVVLGAILFTIALLCRARFVSEPQLSSPASPAVDALAPREPELVSVQSQTLPVEREEIAGTDQDVTLASTSQSDEPAFIRGRCVRAEDNAPLEGCSVLLLGSALNSGAALYAAGIADSIADGVKLALAVLAGGKARERLRALAARSQMASGALPL